MFEIWIRAITPGLAVGKAVTAYETLLEEAPKPTLGTAVKWVAISGAIVGVIQVFTALVFGVPEGQFTENLLLWSIQYVIGGPIVGVIAFVITSVIVLGIAKALGGQGNLANQSYMLAAVIAPMTIIITVLQRIPGLVGNLIVVAALIYYGWLTIVVLRAPHQYSGSRAVITMLIFYGVFGCALPLFVYLMISSL